jgi:ABC-2 type transport system permease protein
MNAVSGWRIALVIARRDLVRFLRQPARIAAAIGTPLLFWAFMGGGFAGSFRPAGLGETSYAGFLLPGMITLVAVFSAIFSAFSIIEGRNEGWLQTVLVSPAPRWAIALGKISGSSLLAFVQAAMLMLALPFLDLKVTIAGVGASLLALAITSFAMTAMGLLFAWRSETTASFHAIMNIVFMPMWLLSGAFFPPTPSTEGGASALTWLMRINPLTWCTQAMREPLLNRDATMWLLASLAFAMVMFALATLSVMRNRVA